MFSFNRGARHGLQLTAKLDRVEKQEQILLKKIKNKTKIKNEKSNNKISFYNENNAISDTEKLETENYREVRNTELVNNFIKSKKSKTSLDEYDSKYSKPKNEILCKLDSNTKKTSKKCKNESESFDKIKYESEETIENRKRKNTESFDNIEDDKVMKKKKKKSKKYLDEEFIDCKSKKKKNKSKKNKDKI